MARLRQDYLFAEGDLGATLRAQSSGAVEVVNQIQKDQFLSSNEDQLVTHVLSKLEVEPLVLYEDRAEMEQHETEVDVSGWPGRDWGYRDRSGPLMIPGTKVVVSIPFTGDPTLWKMRPSTYRTTFPHGDVHQSYGDQPGTLVLNISRPHDSPQDEFKQELDRLLSDIRYYIEKQKQDINAFNTSLNGIVASAINDRRQRLERTEGLSQLLEIPLKRRDGAPPIKPIKMERKIVQPLPPPPRSGFKPEPGILPEFYETILTIIRHEGRTFETTPETYAVHDEEGLRNIMLAHLNGHFQGSATGETFRKKGKTDIRIEDQDRAAFIGECKVWRGRKELLEAVDQLVGYLTWRDSKAALIILNKHTKGFAKLLATVPEAIATHPNLVKNLGQQGDGEWRHIFRSEEDEHHQITIHTYLFNIYATKQSKPPESGS